MKKLVIAIGCISAVILMSSCTTDSIQDPNNSIKNNIQKTASPGPVILDTGDDNIDKTKT
jgi:hypothetical protein